MRKLNFLFFIFMPLMLVSNNWFFINKFEKKPYSKIEVIKNEKNNKCISLKFEMSAYELKNVVIDGKIYKEVNAPNCGKILKEGAPELPLFAKSLIIPDEDEMELIIKNYEFIEIDNVLIVPSKGNLLRTVNPKDIPYKFGIEYFQDDFYPYSLGYLKEPYLLRDFRGQTVVLFPFQYNPIQKKLRIFYKIEIEVRSTGDIGLNIYPRNKALKAVDYEFKKIYEKHFVNFESFSKYNPLNDLPGNMLIISYGNFISALEPFIKWKKMKGIPVEVVDVANIGNTPNNIKDYVINYYNTKGLTYLLLVGDYNHVTSQLSSAGGAMDNWYGYILGNDRYQEILIGRFSGETIEDIQTQVERTINYEKNPQLGNWLEKAVGIASEEGPGDDDEYDYQHIRNLLNLLTNYTYNSIAELYEGSQGGEDAIGNPTANMLVNEFNNNAGFMLYCGHGFETGLATTGFSNNNVSQLTNYYKLPFFHIVACVVGKYNEGTCFCEALMRARTTNGPIGALIVAGSTINQSWSPPMEAQDEFVLILTEAYNNNIKRTFAGIFVNGLFKMNDVYADYDMTDTWTVFGDPSLVIRTKNPLTMNVSHPQFLPVSSPTFQLSCDVNEAYVSITKNYNILYTNYVSNNSLSISLNSNDLTIGDTLYVCVTNYNYIPYIGEIIVTSTNLSIDAALSSVISPINFYYCDNITITPKIVLTNYGVEPLISATICYQLDQDTIICQSWNGNLQQFESDTISLQPFILTQGQHLLYCYVVNPNNSVDEFLNNNEKFVYFTVDTSALVLDFTASPLNSCTVPLSVQFTNNSINATNFFWDFGDGNVSTQVNPIHTYSDYGVYTVSLNVNNEECGIISKVKPNYITVGLIPPVVSDVYGCEGTEISLNIPSNYTIYWYNNLNDSIYFHTGNTFSFNLLYNDTFWLMNKLDTIIIYGGNNQINTNGGYLNSYQEHFLVFDVFEEIILKSVEVNAQYSGQRNIQLKDESDNILYSQNINIPEGINRITLNLNIPPGTNYKLIGPAFAGLFRNNAGCQYPYNIGNLASIKYSSASSNPTGYYYYFYNWEVIRPGCESAKVPLYVYVSKPIVNFEVLPETDENAQNGAIYANVQGNPPFTYQWNTGDTTHYLQNITSGTYILTVTDAYGCSVVEQIFLPLNVNNLNPVYNINISPNPFSNFIFINELMTNKKYNIIIENLKGKILHYETLFPINESYILDLHFLKQGIYLVKIFDDAKEIFFIKKIVKFK